MRVAEWQERWGGRHLLHLGRSQHAMVALGGKQLLLLGSYNGERVLNYTWLLDLAARRWTRLRPTGLPFPRQPRLQAQNFRVAPVMLSAARHGGAVYLHHPWGSRMLLAEPQADWRWEADQTAPAAWPPSASSSLTVSTTTSGSTRATPPTST